MLVKNDRSIEILAGGFVLLLMLSSAGATIFAYTPGFTAAVKPSSTTENATYPNVQANGQNVYVAWQQKGKGVDFRMSPNAGST